MPRRLALVLFLAVAPAVIAQENELRDDATGRLRARQLMYGQRAPEEQLSILQEAAKEAAAYAIGQPRLRSASLMNAAGAVPAGTWVNVGPAAGTSVSPLVQVATDSGRMRRIVPDPTDPNVLYVATAGGGVWKTFDAQAAITSTTGPHWTSITSGIGSQSVGAFALDPSNPTNLYLGLGDPFDVQTPGFYTSTDGGITWQGPETLGSATSVRDIVVDPSGTGAVLAATNGGVFRKDKTTPWTQVNLGGATDCWSIAWAGSNGADQRWVAACWGAVFVSVNNGATFTPANAGLGAVGRMTLAAAASDSAAPGTAWVYLLAGTTGGGALQDVYLSKNGGDTWGTLGMDTSSCSPSCKQAVNWTQDQDDMNVLHDQAWYNQAILVDPRNHGRVFVGGNLAAMRSDDAGQSWYVIADWLPASPICPLCANLPYVHADWHTMAASVSTTPLPSYCGVFPNGTATTVPAGTPCFFAGTDGGIFRSSDVFSQVPDASNLDTTKMPHFEGRIGRGLVTHLAYSIATDLHDASNTVMIGGLQDNGTRLRVAASPTTFNQVIGADGFAVGIGISNSTAAPLSCRGHWGSLLLGTIYGVVYRSVDCGASFAPAMTGICKPDLQIFNPGGGCNVDYGSNFFMKLASDQADTSGQVFLTVINNSACDPAQKSCTAAYGTNTVYATHDGAGGTGWAKANGTIHLASGSTATNFSSELRSVSANPKAAGQWAVSDSSRAYVTLNSGTDWQQSASLGAYVSGVAFEDATGSKIWASTGGSGGARYVQRSVDGGASWVDKTGDLPHVPANTVAVDPNDPNTVYLGTEIGLYRTQNGGQNWARYGGASLPLVSVTEINVALDSSAIRISTYGRGFWELTQNAALPSGVYGNGDFDQNQVIDAFDLVREATLLGLTPVNAGYDPVGNLTGATNTIDGADVGALVAKMGGRP